MIGQYNVRGRLQIAHGSLREEVLNCGKGQPKHMISSANLLRSVCGMVDLT